MYTQSSKTVISSVINNYQFYKRNKNIFGSVDVIQECVNFVSFLFF